VTLGGVMASNDDALLESRRHLDDPSGAGPAAGEQPVALGRLLRYGAAFASLTAAAVHASAIGGHAFSWLHLLAFVTMTVFQAWWAYRILDSATTKVLFAGLVGHGAIVGLWLVSRTIGIPSFLPGSHAPETVGLKDGVAVLLAVAVLAAVDALSRRDLVGRLVRPSRAGAAAGAFLLAMTLLGVVGIGAAGHAHDPAGHAHDQTNDQSHDQTHDH
jgi:hypothetical protein